MQTEPNSSPAAPRTPWWLWLNVLSLDAPLVAVLWQAALAHIYRIKLLPTAYLTLGMAVWIIYMIDRVLDSFASTETFRLSARHAFYRKNRKLFTFVIIPVAVAVLARLAITEVPYIVMWRGFMVGTLVALYLLHYAARSHRGIYVAGNLAFFAAGVYVLETLPLMQQVRTIGATILGAFAINAVLRHKRGSFRFAPKELVCGWLFAVGCSIHVNFYTLQTEAGIFAPETLMLALLFAANCIAISCYEKESDSAFDPNAIAQTWPGILRVYPLLLLVIAGFAGFTLQKHLSHELIVYSLAVLGSTLLLGALHLFAKRLRPELSHVLADAALVLPVVVVIAF